MQQERMERQKVAAEAAFAALLEKHKERGTLRQGMSWRVRHVCWDAILLLH